MQVAILVLHHLQSSGKIAAKPRNEDMPMPDLSLTLVCQRGVACMMRHILTDDSLRWDASSSAHQRTLPYLSRPSRRFELHHGFHDQ